jgi:hypothetical protein
MWKQGDISLLLVVKPERVNVIGSESPLCRYGNNLKTGSARV